jgi:hypothetical protein
MHPQPAVPSAPSAPAARYWIDLQPGWRVRVVTPITKSGNYVVKTQPAETPGAGREHVIGNPSGNVVPLKAAPGFLGYEVSFYAIKRGRRGGVRVVFKSAEIHEKGHVSHSRRPIAPLFQIPKQDRWVRILHLIRVAQVDHDSAILAATRRSYLDALTRRVRLDPSACKPGPQLFCSWIPRGIAAIPEVEKRSKGQKHWRPV